MNEDLIKAIDLLLLSTCVKCGVPDRSIELDGENQARIACALCDAGTTWFTGEDFIVKAIDAWIKGDVVEWVEMIPPKTTEDDKRSPSGSGGGGGQNGGNEFVEIRVPDEDPRNVADICEDIGDLVERLHST